MDSFCQDILDTYNLPDNASHQHAIAAMILHLEPLETSKPKRFFAISIVAAQCREFAFKKMQDLKEEEKKKAEEKKVEVDAKTETESVGAQ